MRSRVWVLGVLKGKPNPRMHGYWKMQWKTVGSFKARPMCVVVLGVVHAGSKYESKSRIWIQKDGKMKESDLYYPVRDWLKKNYPDHKIYVEVFDADVVAVNQGHMVVVELKKCCSSDLYRQMVDRARWADEVWCCIATDPKSATLGRREGFGLIQFKNNKLKVIRSAKPQPWGRIKTRAYRLKKLSKRSPAMDHEVAGLPSCNQLREQRRGSCAIIQEPLYDTVVVKNAVFTNDLL